MMKEYWGFSCKSSPLILIGLLQAICLGFPTLHLLLDRLINGIKLLFCLIVHILEPREGPRVTIAYLLVDHHVFIH